MECFYKIKFYSETREVLYSEEINIEPESYAETYIYNQHRGLKLELERLHIRLRNKSHKCLDVIGGTGVTFVVSDKLKKLLESFEENLQFIPVRFSGLDWINRYWYCNVLNNLDVFDWESSKYKARTYGENGKVETWIDSDYNPERLQENVGLKKTDKVVFKRTIDESRHLFQVKYLENYKFVSAELKSKMESEGITGLKFIPLSEFTSGF